MYSLAKELEQGVCQHYNQQQPMEVQALVGNQKPSALHYELPRPKYKNISPL